MVCHGFHDDTGPGAAYRAGGPVRLPTLPSPASRAAEVNLGHEAPAFLQAQYRYVDVYEAVHRGPFGFITEKLLFAAVIFAGMALLRHTTETLGFLNQVSPNLFEIPGNDASELRTFGAMCVGLIFMAGARRVHLEHQQRIVRGDEEQEPARQACSPCLSRMTSPVSTPVPFAASRSAGSASPTPLCSSSSSAGPVLLAPATQQQQHLVLSPLDVLTETAPTQHAGSLQLQQRRAARAQPAPALATAYQAAGIDICCIGAGAAGSADVTPDASPRPATPRTASL